MPDVHINLSKKSRDFLNDFANQYHLSSTGAAIGVLVTSYQALQEKVQMLEMSDDLMKRLSKILLAVNAAAKDSRLCLSLLNDVAINMEDHVDYPGDSPQLELARQRLEKEIAAARTRKSNRRKKYPEHEVEPLLLGDLPDENDLPI